MPSDGTAYGMGCFVGCVVSVLCCLCMYVCVCEPHRHVHEVKQKNRNNNKREKINKKKDKERKNALQCSVCDIIYLSRPCDLCVCSFV